MRADVRPGAADREYERGLHGRAKLTGQFVEHAIYADEEAGIVGHYVPDGDTFERDPNNPDEFKIAESRGVVEIVMPDGWKSSLPVE
jgi:hypothetical protein